MRVVAALWASLLATVLIPANGSADESPRPGAERVEAYLRLLSENDRFNGVVMVSDAAGVAVRSAHGWADLELRVPLAVEHRFRIGSLTKPITASAVLVAVGEERLSLEDRVCDLIDDCPESWRQVTIEHLLTHTSGISDHFGDLEAVPVERTVEELSRVLTDVAADSALDSVPGEAYDYRNFNYVLLGAALEAAYDRPWESVLRSLVLDPLGLTDTAYDDVWRIVPGRVRGYGRDDDGAVHNIEYSDHAAYAAGGLYSTAPDLITWAEAVFSGRLLGRLTEPTFTPVLGDYGYGWQIRRFFDRPIYNHTGGIDGFSSHIAHYPDDELTIVVLSNVESDSAILTACDVAAAWYALRPLPEQPLDWLELAPRVRCGLETE